MRCVLISPWRRSSGFDTANLQLWHAGLGHTLLRRAYDPLLGPIAKPYVPAVHGVAANSGILERTFECTSSPGEVLTTEVAAAL